jgi:hypothetical protein
MSFYVVAERRCKLFAETIVAHKIGTRIKNENNAVALLTLLWCASAAATPTQAAVALFVNAS